MRVYISWLIYTDDGSPIKSLITNTMTTIQLPNEKTHGWNTWVLQQEQDRKTFSDRQGNVRSYSQHNQSYSSFKRK